MTTINKSETKKILDPKIEVEATCVRVPVFNCHSESVNVEFHNPISAKKNERTYLISKQSDDSGVEEKR